MMRKMFSVALLATLACALGLAQSANAGVTYDIVFHDSAGDLTVLPGDTAAPGCVGAWATYTTGRCMDVIMIATDPTIAFSTRVGYTSASGLAVSSMHEWLGVGVSWNKLGLLQQTCAPFDGMLDNGTEVAQFDCIISPNNPPVMPAGTYKIGTIVWDTSGVTPGSELLQALVTGIGAIINGNIIETGGLSVKGSVLLNIIPEPGTASLLGLGLVGLILAGRRSRA